MPPCAGLDQPAGSDSALDETLEQNCPISCYLTAIPYKSKIRMGNAHQVGNGLVDVLTQTVLGVA